MRGLRESERHGQGRIRRTKIFRKTDSANADGRIEKLVKNISWNISGKRRREDNESASVTSTKTSEGILFRTKNVPIFLKSTNSSKNQKRLGEKNEKSVSIFSAFFFMFSTKRKNIKSKNHLQKNVHSPPPHKNLLERRHF